MPGNYSTTSNFALRYLLGTSNASDIDAGFQALAQDVDSKMLGYVQDTHAKAPAAGVTNRIFKETDTGRIFHDNGVAFEQLLGPGAETDPAAQITPTLGEVITPSASKWTVVYLQLELTSGGSSIAVQVGPLKRQVGAFAIGAGVASGSSTLPVILPPGMAYKLVLTGAGSAKASYHFI